MTDEHFAQLYQEAERRLEAKVETQPKPEEPKENENDSKT